jgi:hypothetical protein
MRQDHRHPAGAHLMITDQIEDGFVEDDIRLLEDALADVEIAQLL